MRKLSKAVLVLAASSVGLLAIGCGAGVSTGVYVGVGVAGPYGGYHGGYPGYMGRPPVRYYEEDAWYRPVELGERYARSAAQEQKESLCKSGPKGSLECVSKTEQPAAPKEDERGEPASAN